MKFLLVATFLLVACIFTPSWAAPLREEDEARAVLRAIQLLLASEYHGHNELVKPDNGTGSCTTEDSKKVDCGHVGITQQQCVGKKCCWKESNIGGVPYCFFEESNLPQCQTNDRVECGYLGIKEAECLYRGCCWSPANGQPWCYYMKALEPECQVDPADRGECGYLGISEERCKGYGCCWNPTNIRGSPWCFVKPAPTTASSP